MGYPIHAGMVVVADGTKGERPFERVLTTDRGTGVLRLVD